MQCANASDWITCKTVISLPCEVQTHASEKHDLGWLDGATCVVYVRLMGVVEGYAMRKDTDRFELL